ncbi:hypothetical protein A3J90_08180 [candidate division WOR-1 bacterium RIFOXYC2_FULL_37_10]|uniref:Uncharacterized protein n=1 Tax=candidate division WOR-1 bacterium RIFOXYB2_FULL_37_13 TaxID=1802579 RepID=A0A1F4SQE7_UNCSA|nr:MAG: hypothetical protein A2310_07840 [candidate division WOR-1 bacterium RIFOXYB2_FULL_37_13]OGC37375.1 MAG: hypothetical protein A3J90_08180 [candidate division WOR-1 bacterium RIFOXYC2_FULL_37_10]
MVEISAVNNNSNKCQEVPLELNLQQRKDVSQAISEIFALDDLRTEILDLNSEFDSVLDPKSQLRDELGAFVYSHFASTAPSQTISSSYFDKAGIDRNTRTALTRAGIITRKGNEYQLNFDPIFKNFSLVSISINGRVLNNEDKQELWNKLIQALSDKVMTYLESRFELRGTVLRDIFGTLGASFANKSSQDAVFSVLQREGYVKKIKLTSKDGAPSTEYVINAVIFFIIQADRNSFDSLDFGNVLTNVEDKRKLFDILNSAYKKEENISRMKNNLPIAFEYTSVLDSLYSDPRKAWIIELRERAVYGGDKYLDQEALLQKAAQQLSINTIAIKQAAMSSSLNVLSYAATSLREKRNKLAEDNDLLSLLRQFSGADERIKLDCLRQNADQTIQTGGLPAEPLTPEKTRELLVEALQNKVITSSAVTPSKNSRLSRLLSFSTFRGARVGVFAEYFSIDSTDDSKYVDAGQVMLPFSLQWSRMNQSGAQINSNFYGAVTTPKDFLNIEEFNPVQGPFRLGFFRENVQAKANGGTAYRAFNFEYGYLGESNGSAVRAGFLGNIASDSSFALDWEAKATGVFGQENLKPSGNLELALNGRVTTDRFNATLEGHLVGGTLPYNINNSLFASYGDQPVTLYSSNDWLPTASGRLEARADCDVFEIGDNNADWLALSLYGRGTIDYAYQPQQDSSIRAQAILGPIINLKFMNFTIHPYAGFGYQIDGDGDHGMMSEFGIGLTPSMIKKRNFDAGILNPNAGRLLRDIGRQTPLGIDHMERLVPGQEVGSLNDSAAISGSKLGNFDRTGKLSALPFNNTRTPMEALVAAYEQANVSPNANKNIVEIGDVASLEWTVEWAADASDEEKRELLADKISERSGDVDRDIQALISRRRWIQETQGTIAKPNEWSQLATELLLGLKVLYDRNGTVLLGDLNAEDLQLELDGKMIGSNGIHLTRNILTSLLKAVNTGGDTQLTGEIEGLISNMTSVNAETVDLIMFCAARQSGINIESLPELPTLNALKGILSETTQGFLSGTLSAILVVPIPVQVSPATQSPPIVAEAPAAVQLDPPIKAAPVATEEPIEIPLPPSDVEMQILEDFISPRRDR